jgi:sporulation protein YqfC
MARLRQKFKRWMTHSLELPADVVMDLPRITMIGHLHIYIENHRGVKTFSNEELCLILEQGEVRITGKDFVLKTILPEEILLEGKIADVRYIDIS